MKYNKLHIVIFIISLISALSANGSELKIAIEKKVYLLDEPIYIEISETNTTDKKLKTHYLYTGMYSCFSFKFISKPSYPFSLIAMSHNYPHISSTSTIELLPGESHYHIKQINSLYGVHDKEQKHGISSYYFPPGRYTLRFIHKTWEYEKKIWGKKKRINNITIRSNKVSFTVVEPSGELETERQKYLETIQLYSSVHDNIQREKIIEEFASVYPNSVYLPVLLYKYIYPYRSLFDQSLNKIKAVDIVEKYKDSYVIGYLHYYQKDIYNDMNIKDYDYHKRKQMLKFYNKLYSRIVNDYQGTKLAKYAESKLK